MTAPLSFEPAVSSRNEAMAGPESVRKDTRLLLVSNDAMRARRRPLAVLAIYLYQLIVALVLVWPLSRALGSVFAGHPRGSAVLFDDGGWALLALNHWSDRITPGLTVMVTCALLLGSVLGLVPLATLLVSVSHATPNLGAPRPRHLAPYVVAMFPPLLALFAAFTLLEVALLLLGWRLGSYVADGFAERWGDARADQLGFVAFMFVLALASVIGIVHDLARAALARFRLGFRSAIRAAVRTLLQNPARVLWSCIWRGLAGWLAVFLAAAVTHPRLPIFLVIVLHQLTIGARVAFRSSWFAAALRAVDAAPRKASL